MREFLSLSLSPSFSPTSFPLCVSLCLSLSLPFCMSLLSLSPSLPYENVSVSLNLTVSSNSSISPSFLFFLLYAFLCVPLSLFLLSPLYMSLSDCVCVYMYLDVYMSVGERSQYHLSFSNIFHLIFLETVSLNEPEIHQFS